MNTFVAQTSKQRLTRILETGWEILSQRIATGRVKINKEAFFQLHYSSILLTLGELLCVEPDETFSVELESANSKKSIDITCHLGDAEAAIELKCFRKSSNRAMDTDMYDVLKDVERLCNYKDFQVRMFICVTDDRRYVVGQHRGHAGTVTIRDGTKYIANTPIMPSWVGTWKDRSRDRALFFNQNIDLIWSENKGWYSLALLLA